MKTPKSISLSALAMLNKNKILRRKAQQMKNSPAKSLRGSTPVSAKKKKLLSGLTNNPKNQSQKTKASKASSKGAASTSSLPGPSEVNGSSLPYSKSEAEKCFEWLIGPLPPAQFYQEVFEKRPFLVKRHNKDYYKGLFGCQELDKVLRERQLKFSEDIDVTSYMNGVKKVHNGDGRAYAAVIWDSYQNGRSIRLLMPQTLNKSMWKLCSLLSEYFGNFVGSNIYLTPPGTQGFAPHYDDIEAFVLQLEGQKNWKVYSPRREAEELPRFSSADFSQDELGEEFLDVVLQPGDLLYFPRGFVHQAKSVEEEHSMHLTLSACQRTTWGDLLEKLLPRTLQAALEEDIEYRRSLPREYLSYMGVVNSDKNCAERDAFLSKAKQLTVGLARFLCTDAAVDQMAKDFIHSALPPIITEEEKSCSIHGDGEFWKDGKVHNAVELDLDTKVRLLRKDAIRIVMEEECVRMYHSMENTRVYKEVQPQYVDIGFDLMPAVEALLEAYPQYLAVQDFPLTTDDDKLNLAGLLYDKGLLMSEFPLMASDD